MAHKVDGVEVTGLQAKWVEDQELNPWDNQPQYLLSEDLTAGAPLVEAAPQVATKAVKK